jgi:WD40 repeat protein
MGVVFKARQLGLNRMVALKVLRSGHLASLSELQRFHVEARAVACLDHPNIVPIHDAGEQGGFRYLSMRLVEGDTLAAVSRACDDRNPLWMRQGIGWIVTVARAVHYAHQHGILHRDVKPGNILIDSRGQPHLTDFGLAKMTEGTLSLTGSQSSLGTPEYASPEQLDCDVRETTTASDVYSLGAVIYQVLTGQPPFQGNTPIATLRQVLDRPARSPRLLNAAVDQDLATICLKCLEKDPGARYASADALAEDLQRWRERKPIRARPVAPLQQAMRFARRYPVGSTLATLLLLALGVGGAVVLHNNQEMRQALTVVAEARVKETLAQSSREWLLHKGLLAQASAVRKSPSIGRRFESIDLLQQAADLMQSERLASEAAAALATLDLQETSRHELPSISASQTLHHGFLTLDARLQVVAAHYPSKGLVLSSLGGGGVVGCIEEGATPFSPSVILSPDGRWLACCRDSHLELRRSDNMAAVFRWPLPTNQNRVGPTTRQPVAFSPDNRWLATAGDPMGIRLVDLAGMRAPKVVGAHLQPDLLAWSPDGSRLAVIEDNWVEVLEQLSGERVGFFTCPGAIRWLAWSPDGEEVAVASRHNTAVELRKALTGEQRVTIGLPAPARRMAFHPDGRLLAVATDDKQVGLWDLSTMRRLMVFEGHPRVLQFSEDGATLASASTMNQVVCYEIFRSDVFREFSTLTGGHADSGYSIDINPEGTLLVSADATSLRFWDVAGGREILSLPQPSPLWTHLRFTDQGQGVLVNPRDQGVYRRALNWQAAKPDGIRVEPAQLVADHPHCAYWVGLNDRHAVVLDHAAGEVHLWTDGIPGAPQVIACLGSHQATMPSLSADGRLLALNHFPGGQLELWSTERGEPIRTLPGNSYTGAQFTPDGRYLLAATRSKLSLWDTRTWQQVQVVAEGLDRRAYDCLLFSPGGGRVVVQTAASRHRIYSYPGFETPLDIASANPLSRHACRWSKDGHRLYTLDRGNHLYEWKVSVLLQELSELGFRRLPTSTPSDGSFGAE